MTKKNSTNEMLSLLKEQERRIIEADRQKPFKGEISLSPKIDIEERLRNGYISADDYVKTHQWKFPFSINTKITVENFVVSKFRRTFALAYEE